MKWLKDELRKNAAADDLHISPFREDGKTYGTQLGFGPPWWMTRSMCAATSFPAKEVHLGRGYTLSFCAE